MDLIKQLKFQIMKSKLGRILILIVLAAVVACSYGAYLFLLPNVILKTDKDEFLLIRENAVFDDVLEQLQQKAEIKSVKTFRKAAEYLRYSNIRSGRYKIENGMNNLKLVRNLRNGNQTPVKITFNNIRTKEQLAGRLSALLMPDSAKIIELLNDTVFLAGYGLNPNTSVTAFIPDTYEVFWNMSPQRLFERMYREYDKFWNDERKQKAKAIPMSQAEVCTLASIVDAETNSKSEKPVVAGLYINRLRKNMPLQADPTVIFAAGDFTIKRVLNVHTRIDSPYNTYRYAGLPPGPIRIPTVSGLDAVLNYDRNDYIYMCAKETLNGEHNFAATWAQHAVNANKYQKAMNERGIR